MSNTAPSQANPASAFFAGTFVRSLALALRLSDSVAPAASTRLALRLFFTPFPSKLAARRRALPEGWSTEQWSFEQGVVAVHRRRALPPGTPDTRPTVLLVHGWAGDAQQMLAMAEAVEAAGMAAVLLDLPAHGRSSGWRASLPQFVRVLWTVSARLGPLHGVVAHSLGALAAAHAAANGWPVGRLALVAASPPPRLFLQWFAGSLGLGEGLSRRMGSAIEQVEGVPLTRFEPAWLGPRMRQPTLVVHDEGDRVSPLAVGQRLAEAAGARFLATQALGHRRVLADAAVAAAVTDHLRPNGSEM